ncbi:DAO-domain-containing protein [Aureobasidium namibiae CBS 147.97]|uniref:DAO-domain-containing protein n=1 Tax=Aureobasidium namibiae CBS 147.97 TaxID=1043004 RepID=A0A074WEA4_9PEZI
MPSRNDTPESPFAALRDLKPALPYSNSAISYWHRTTRAFAHLRANETSPLPVSTKYTIIGSGLSGSLTAFELIKSGIPAEQILILEAREAVSGSSGRNAGHVRPDPCSEFSGYAIVHGSDKALEIVKHEMVVLDLVQEFVKTHNIDCEFRPKQTFDVCLTREIAESEMRNVEQYVSAGGSLDHIRYHEGNDAKERTGVHDALSAWEWPAATIHPVKLAQWLLSSSIDKGCKLFTHCPVIQITQNEDETWNMHTNRGMVSTNKVIHCTNAYAGSLLPQLSAMLLTPIKVQMHSLIPDQAFSGGNMLQASMALRYEEHRYYALTQMEKDGTIIFGVAKPSGFTFDDTSYTDELVIEGLEKFEESHDRPSHYSLSVLHTIG